MPVTCVHTAVSGQQSSSHSELAVDAVRVLLGLHRLLDQHLDGVVGQVSGVVHRLLVDALHADSQQGGFSVRSVNESLLERLSMLRGTVLGEELRGREVLKANHLV